MCYDTRMPRWIISLAMVGVCMAASARAQDRTPEPPVVVAQGEGIVRTAPDQAFVRIGAEARAGDPKDAQAANAAAMTAVQERILSAGIGKDAVRTVTISLQQEFDYVDGKQRPRGYVARNVVEVRVDDLAALGAVMDASVGSGATSVQGLRFDLKGRDAAEREALKRAVADAVARAGAAAGGAGREVDRVLRIEETGSRAMPRPEMAFMARATADQPQTTPIAEGEIEVRAQVTVTASIK